MTECLFDSDEMQCIKSLFQKILKDHLSSKILDQMTYEELLYNLDDYFDDTF